MGDLHAVLMLTA